MDGDGMSKFKIGDRVVHISGERGKVIINTYSNKNLIVIQWKVNHLSNTFMPDGRFIPEGEVCVYTTEIWDSPLMKAMREA
jgi:hypothetical protein